jgi:hypothetical protein
MRSGGSLFPEGKFLAGWFSLFTVFWLHALKLPVSDPPQVIYGVFQFHVYSLGKSQHVVECFRNAIDNGDSTDTVTAV